MPRRPLLLVILLAACSASPVPEDAFGAVDAPGADAGERDAGTSSSDDAGPIDAPERPDASISTEPYPSVFPLELVLPRNAGTRPAEAPRGVGLEPTSLLPAVPATHRIYRAYPGLPYEIRAAVIGGSYPYTYALRDAPAGMSIDAATGVIRWESPDADATPTIVVTDMEGTIVSSPWSIRVGTERFRFVDAARGAHYPAGDGSAERPYQDFVDLKDDPAADYGDIVYFRTGVYGPAGIPRASVGTAWERVEWGSADPQTWLAYPGETPILDFGFVAGVDRAAVFRVSGAYIDGFETRNARNIGFQLAGGEFNVLRRLDMHDHNPGGEDLDGQNPGHVMSIDSEKWYTVIQDCRFHDAPTAGGLKLYNEGRPLIEDNMFFDAFAGCDWKVGVERGTFRGNALWNLGEVGLYGNMNTRYGMRVADCEVDYNFFDLGTIVPADAGDDSAAVGLDWDGEARAMYVYRNTIIGRALVAAAGPEDGPFVWARNVIVNDRGGVESLGVTDPTRVVLEENLLGTTSDGVVDAAGRLTEAYAAYRGTHGHEVRF